MMDSLQVTVRSARRPTVHFAVPSGSTLDVPGFFRELDLVTLEVAGLPDSSGLSLLVGDVSVDTPPPERILRQDGSLSVCWRDQQPFERWAGHCTVRVVEADDPESTVCALNVLVYPSKITAAELDHLLEDLSRVEIGLILDVYGKTSVAATERRSLVGMAPEYFLRKTSWALAEFGRWIPAINRRPQEGFRLSVERSRRAQGTSVHPADLAALCRRPTGLTPARANHPEAVQVAGRVMVVDCAPQSTTVPDLDVYEHRALSWFLRRLRRGLLTLRELALAEHWRRENEHPHWWQSWQKEDQPRLQPLLDRAHLCSQYVQTIDKWLQREPLAEAGVFTPPLRPTATFRRHAAYRRLYLVMQEFSQTGEFKFASDGNRYKAQNLSALYEYWAALQMLLYLCRRFRADENGIANAVDTQRFILTLREDFSALFQTCDGRWLRYRYEPTYVSCGEPGAVYGRLAVHADPFRPDIALEVLQSPEQVIPDRLLVFDVKYKRNKAEPVAQDLTDTAQKYLNFIGRFDTFESLTRHSWIIYPSDRPEPWTQQPLFSQAAPKSMKTTGAVPLLPGYDEVFRTTLDRLLDFEGLLPI